MMLGQMRIEFIFGIVIFCVIIFYVVTQTNILFSSLVTDSKSDALKAKASEAIKILVEDPGDPLGWDMMPVGSVKRVGLAYSVVSVQPYNLSKSKVLALNANCSGSDMLKNMLWNYELNAYRLRIFNSTHEILSCGFRNPSSATVTETRYVFIDNGYGSVVLELW
ncbi:MAG: hypothetical protein V1678_03300 [Candidatus Aenigmatarchaeota archaeon]